MIICHPVSRERDNSCQLLIVIFQVTDKTLTVRHKISRGHHRCLTTGFCKRTTYCFREWRSFCQNQIFSGQGAILRLKWLFAPDHAVHQGGNRGRLFGGKLFFPNTPESQADDLQYRFTIFVKSKDIESGTGCSPLPLDAADRKAGCRAAAEVKRRNGGRYKYDIVRKRVVAIEEGRSRQGQATVQKSRMQDKTRSLLLRHFNLTENLISLHPDTPDTPENTAIMVPLLSQVCVEGIPLMPFHLAHRKWFKSGTVR